MRITQLRRRAIERAQIEVDLARRRFMLVDPGNRLVADTLEADWNDKLRALAAAREDYEHARQADGADGVDAAQRPQGRHHRLEAPALDCLLCNAVLSRLTRSSAACTAR